MYQPTNYDDLYLDETLDYSEVHVAPLRPGVSFFSAFQSDYHVARVDLFDTDTEELILKKYIFDGEWSFSIMMAYTSQWLVAAAIA